MLNLPLSRRRPFVPSYLLVVLCFNVVFITAAGWRFLPVARDGTVTGLPLRSDLRR